MNAAAELVARTTAAQGLPKKVTDPATLRRVAGILRAPMNGNGPPKGADTISFAATVATTEPTDGEA